MIWDASHVIHVFMSKKHIFSIHAALWTAASVKDDIGGREDDAGLLQRPCAPCQDLLCSQTLLYDSDLSDNVSMTPGWFPTRDTEVEAVTRRSCNIT